MRGTSLASAVIALAVVSGSHGDACAQEALKVAVPQRGAWDAGLAELGRRAGIFKKHGLDLEILYTQAGPESIQALIAGSVDIATASGVSAAFGTFAKGAPIRIISSEVIGAPDLYWYVPAASPIRKIEDFNDKTVAYSLTGSSSHAGLLALIAHYKLNAKPTSTGSITATLTQTMTAQVDVGFSAIPFFLDKVDEGQIRIIATGSDVPSLKARTGRVNITNVSTLQNRRGGPGALSSRLQGEHRLAVRRSGRDQGIQRLFRSAGKGRRAGAGPVSQGDVGARSRGRRRSDHGRGDAGQVHYGAAHRAAGGGTNSDS